MFGAGTAHVVRSRAHQRSLSPAQQLGRTYVRVGVAIAVAMLVAGALASCGGSSSKTATGVKGGREVTAEPVSTAGANPFTPAVGKDSTGVKPPRAAASKTSGLPAFKADLPGLYGGTRNYATCDASKLVTFLEQNPAKATAWARTLGLTTSRVRRYVSGLTPVTLRTDTRVTNHGFVNGQANPIQSVLEAGTAVFVNKYGEPVVKCYCGNPLTAYIPYDSPTYVGPRWSGFSQTNITIINQSTTIIHVFKLYDPSTGQLFARPAGSSGERDGAVVRNAPPTNTTTTTSPQPQATTETRPSAPQPARNPAAGFSPSSGTVSDAYTIRVTGFRPNATLKMQLTRPDGGIEHYTISTNASGSGSYTFPHVNNPAPGTYSAVVSDGQTGDSASASTRVSP